MAVVIITRLYLKNVLLYIGRTGAVLASNVGDQVILRYAMCLREWCVRCFKRREKEEAEEPSPDPPQEPAPEERSSIPAPLPVTPPRPNKSKLEAALREATSTDPYNRQISSVSEDSPEALKRQTGAFQSFQHKERKNISRKRLKSSPGKLERTKFHSQDSRNSENGKINKTDKPDIILLRAGEVEAAYHVPDLELGIRTEPLLIREADLYTPDPTDITPLNLSVISLETQEPESPVFQLVPVQVHHQPLHHQPLHHQPLHHQPLHHQVDYPINQKTQTEFQEININCFVEEGTEEEMGRFGVIKSRKKDGSEKRDKRKHDPKREVHNVHTIEHRESAVSNNELSRRKNFSKTKQYKKTLHNELPEERRSTKPDLLTTALLAGAGAGVMNSANLTEHTQSRGNTVEEETEKEAEREVEREVESRRSVSQPILVSRDASKTSVNTSCEWDPDYLSTLSGVSHDLSRDLYG